MDQTVGLQQHVSTICAFYKNVTNHNGLNHNQKDTIAAANPKVLPSLKLAFSLWESMGLENEISFWRMVHFQGRTVTP